MFRRSLAEECRRVAREPSEGGDSGGGAGRPAGLLAGEAITAELLGALLDGVFAPWCDEELGFGGEVSSCELLETTLVRALHGEPAGGGGGDTAGDGGAVTSAAAGAGGGGGDSGGRGGGAGGEQEEAAGGAGDSIASAPLPGTTGSGAGGEQAEAAGGGAGDSIASAALPGRTGGAGGAYGGAVDRAQGVEAGGRGGGEQDGGGGRFAGGRTPGAAAGAGAGAGAGAVVARTADPGGSMAEANKPPEAGEAVVSVAGQEAGGPGAPESVPLIVVCGVGGGGGNAVSRMAGRRPPAGVRTLVCNTDAQALAAVVSDAQLLLGERVSGGRGAGSDPRIGREAAEESWRAIGEMLTGAEVVFVTCGLGGGTGSGAAPVVAAAARALGALTVGIATLPFSWEGWRRREVAEASRQRLLASCDAVIVIPNDRLGELGKLGSLGEAFEAADRVLIQGVGGIADLLTRTGMVNLDLSDVRRVLTDSGHAVLAIGEGTEARQAVREALRSPLLDTSLHGAGAVILHMLAGFAPPVEEMELAAALVQEEALGGAASVADGAESGGGHCDLFWGVTEDAALGETVRVTIVAGGFPRAEGNVAASEEASEEASAEGSAAGEASEETRGEGSAAGAQTDTAASADEAAAAEPGKSAAARRARRRPAKGAGAEGAAGRSAARKRGGGKADEPEDVAGEGDADEPAEDVGEGAVGVSQLADLLAGDGDEGEDDAG